MLIIDDAFIDIKNARKSGIFYNINEALYKLQK
jgi:hypothetical protein